MKNACYSIIILSIVALCACKRQCDKPSPSNIYINKFDSTSDSVMVITKYTKGTSFKEPLDSTTLFIVKNWDYKGVAKGHSLEVDYDYLIAIRPSGKAYLITEMSYGNETVETAFAGITPTCTATFYYTVNGVAKTRSSYLDKGPDPSSENITLD